MIGQTIGSESKSLRRCIPVMLVGAALLWAGDPWKEKPYTEWTPEETRKVLQKSPWSKQVSVRVSLQYVPDDNYDIRELGSDLDRARNRAQGIGPSASEMAGVPGTGATRPPRPVPVVAHFLIQWASSLTVRQALVRQRQLQNAASEEEFEEVLSAPPEHHLIIVRPRPAMYGPDVRERVRQAAYLELKRSKEKIPPLGIQLLADSVVFLFPRQVGGQPVIGADETQVKFFCELGYRKIKADFNLRKTVRGGQRDL